MEWILIARVVLLTLTIWGGQIVLSDVVHGRPCHWLNLLWPAVTGSLFALSMGWLS